MSTSIAADALPPAGPVPASRRRRALGYAAAWLPFLGLYALVFLATGFRAEIALAGAAGNVLPPALLGIAVVRLCSRLPWPPRHRGRFAAAHLGTALVFATAAAAGTQALLAVLRRLLENRPLASEMDWRIVVWQFFLDLVAYSTLVSVVYAVQTAERLRREEARTVHAEALRAQAELRALRAQLNPHFLFNTLHTLLALVRRDPAAAEEALEQFGDLLRYALSAQDGRGEEVTLAEEWEFVGNYLALERLRLGDRLAVEERIDPEALGCLVPAFSLQPLVENAIRHGIAPRAGRGRLTVAAGVADGTLALEVRDDGPGATTGAVELEEDDGDGDSAGRGLGLRLVRRRLAALHGEAGRLVVTTAPGAGFAVTVRLPARKAER